MNQLLQQSALDLRQSTQQRQSIQPKPWHNAARKAIRNYYMKKDLQYLKNTLFTSKHRGISGGLNLKNPGLVGRLGGVVGGWKELGRTTLGAANQNIDVGSLASKRYLQILHFGAGLSGGSNPRLKCGNGTIDAGNNFADRYSVDGGADTTETSNAFGTVYEGSGVGVNVTDFVVGFISNFATKEKLTQLWHTDIGAAGASTPPQRTKAVGKWANATNILNILRSDAASGITWDSTSELVVLGWDPADNHTDNFFLDNGNGTASGSSSTLDVTLTTAKKYNWFQGVFKVGSVSDVSLRFGNASLDTGNNYARRRSINGGVDATEASASGINLGNFGTGELVYIIGFWINVSAKEKLVQCWLNSLSAAGAGTAPSRSEIVGKHVNTTNQDDHIGFFETTGNLNSITQLHNWGGN